MQANRRRELRSRVKYKNAMMGSMLKIIALVLLSSTFACGGDSDVGK